MKKPKPIIINHPIQILKIILSIFLLFYFLLNTGFVHSQTLVPNGKQWQNVGGKIVASGHHKFNNGWYAGNGLYWKNDEDRSKPASHTAEEVNKDIIVNMGQVTVRGPGFIALFSRMKGGVSSFLQFPETDNKFWPASLGYQEWQYGGPDGGYSWHDNNIRDFDPSINNNGWIPEGKTYSFDVVIRSNWSEGGSWRGYAAPKEIEYEFWFFGREGSEIITTAISAGFDKPQPGILYYTEKECK